MTDDDTVWLWHLRKDAADTARTLRDIARGKHMDAPPTGVDNIRGALKNRLKHGHGGVLARELGIALTALDDFANGSGRLPDATLDALAKDLFHGAGYDPQRNLLTRKKSEVKPIGVAPPPAKPNPSLPRTAAPCTMVSTPLPPAPAKKRAGWADD